MSDHCDQVPSVGTLHIFRPAIFVLCVFAIMGTLWLIFSTKIVDIVAMLTFGDDYERILRSQKGIGFQSSIFSVSAVIVFGVGALFSWFIVGGLRLSKRQVSWKKWCWVYVLSALKIPAFLLFQYLAPLAGYSDVNIFILSVRLLVIFTSIWTYLPFYAADLATYGDLAWGRLLKRLPLLVITDILAVMVVLTFGGKVGSTPNLDWLVFNGDTANVVCCMLFVLLAYIFICYVMKKLINVHYSKITWGNGLSMLPLLLFSIFGVPFLIMFYIFF